MALKEFIEASSFFDQTDRDTRITIGVINEAEQKELLLNLTNKLYDKIVKNIVDIDFGLIPESKGDITKIPNYQLLVDSLDDMEGIYKHYRQDLSYINTIKTTIENIKRHKDNFHKAFAANCSMPMTIYNTITLSIVSSVSLLISTTIDFFVDPKNKTIKMSLDAVSLKNSKDKLLFDNLKSFNEMCRDKKLAKLIDGLVQAKARNLEGFSVIALIGIGIGLAFTIVPLLRELIYYFYHCRTSIADYFEIQATMLELNAARLEQNGDKSVSKEQRKYAERFRRISDSIAVESKEAQRDSEKQIKKEKEEEKHSYKIDDVSDSLPDSAASASSMF